MRTVRREVVGAFVFSADNCLLLGKSIKGGVYPDTWLVPGGGIKSKETKVQAAQRELEEETGLHVNEGLLKPLPNSHSGTSEKTLRETGELVIMKMTFWDFEAHLAETSDQIEIGASDDLDEVRWFPVQELAELALATGTKNRLQNMGLI